MRVRRVLICDDHQIVREALRAQFDGQDDLEVVAVAGDAAMAEAAVIEYQPDLVTLDIELPDSDGIVVIGRLLGRKPDLRILAFSAHDGPEVVRLAAESGAHGFVSKSESTLAIVPAARELLAGENWFPQLQEAGDDGPRTDDELHRLRSLTPREREILELFAEGMRADGVAEKTGISRATVYTHVRNAIHKLDVDSRTQAVALATRYAFLQDQRVGRERD